MKSNTVSKKYSKNGKSKSTINKIASTEKVPAVRTIMQFSKASPTMLFRMMVILTTLIVAILAILRDIDNPNVWTFLGSVVFYAALTVRSDTR